MVFSPPHSLTALSVRGRRRIDILRDRRRADEADCFDPPVGQQHIDRFLIAIDDIQDTGRRPRLMQELSQPQGHRRILLGRLQYESIAAGDGHCVHPHGDHGREIERRDPGANTKRLAHRIHIDIGRNIVRKLALHEMRNAAGELDHIEPPLHVTDRVRENLAMLDGQHLAQHLAFVGRQFKKLEHDAAALDDRSAGPIRESGFGGSNRPFNLRLRGQRHLAGHLAGRRIEHIAVAATTALDGLSIDKMPELGHRSFSLVGAGSW